MDISLDRKRTRERLAPRPDPYWQKLAKGAYLGFRRGPDTWHARFRGRDGKQQWKPLHGIQADDFDGAKKAAEEWLAQLAGSPVRTAKRDTVRAALEAYLTDLRRQRRAKAATEAEGRFKCVVYGDNIADLSLEEARKEDFQEWRDRLNEGRQPRSINRHVRSVIAGLNVAHELGHVGNPTAWKLKPLADDTDDTRDTAVFLTTEQRTAIIEAAGPQLAEFLRGLGHTGARPGELAETTAGDFDGKQIRLQHRKGKPPKLRVRYTELASEGMAFFTAQTRSKLPAAPIFTEDGSTPWRRHVWAREMRAAIKKANESLKGKARIPIEASAYSFRHARISELLQVHDIDPVTVAHMTGTSVVMIEKHYFKFIASSVREKLDAMRLTKKLHDN